MGKIFLSALTLIKEGGKSLQAKFNGRSKDNIKNLQSYGFVSHPPVKSNVVIINDDYGNPYGIAYLNSVIPELKENEVAVGNLVIGSIIKFLEDGTISIECKKDTNININGDYNLTSPNIKLNGNVTISGTLEAGATTINGTMDSGAITSTGTIKATDGIFNNKPYSAHTHTTIAIGSPTSPPI